jgi:membrane-bound lytic murein transglycosylase D
LSLLFFLIIFPAIALAQPLNIVVITSQKSTLQPLTKNEVQHLFLRQPDAKLPSSLKPYDMRRDSDIYYNFYQYLGYSKKHLQQYLSTQGSATTLKRLPNVENTEQAIQLLQSDPDAVVYIPAIEYQSIIAHFPVKLLYSFNSASHPSLSAAPQVSTGHEIQAASNLWQNMIKGFAFTQDFDRTEVAAERKALLKNPADLHFMIENAIPYLAYINQQCALKKLPRELALLPMVESGYNPFAYSKTGASGLWQIMPQTAIINGLNISWWYDSRRDVLLSTHVALDYLRQLHQQYGNWYEALSAYNAGPSKVNAWVKQQSINDDNDYWNMQWPTSTRQYVVKLIAIASIIAHHKQYGFNLPALSIKPFFTTVSLRSQISLPVVAKFSGVSENLILYLNPALLRKATSNRGAYTLLLPIYAAPKFVANINLHSGKPYASWLYHQVYGGETLKQIASEYHTTPGELKTMNRLNITSLTPGQGLIVPVNLGLKYIAIRPRH